MNKINKMMNKVAEKNGYNSVEKLLMDYNFLPTVFTPKHKKIGILKAIAKTLKDTNK